MENRPHRCFIGVPVAPALTPALVDARQRLLAGVEARPVPEANLHLTLVFLGALDGSQVGEAMRTVEDLSLPPAPGEQPLTRIGGFPNAQSRIVAAEGEATAVLASLVAGLRSRLKQAGLPRGDERAFRPHVTLAKLPRSKALPTQECRLALPLEEVVLYESVAVSGAAGVEYRCLARRAMG